MTKNEAIAREFASYLSGITTAGGYRTDFPTVDYMNPDIQDKEDEVFVNINDSTSFENGRPFEENLIITITIGVCKGASSATYLNKMIADVYKCVHTNKKAIEIKYKIGQIIPQSDVKRIDRFEKIITEADINFTMIMTQNAQWIIDTADY
jgi:hypothetical protein